MFCCQGLCCLHPKEVDLDVQDVDLKLYPDKVLIQQKINQELLCVIGSVEEKMMLTWTITDLCFTGKAHFLFSGQVNNQSNFLR